MLTLFASKDKLTKKTVQSERDYPTGCGKTCYTVLCIHIPWHLFHILLFYSHKSKCILLEFHNNVKAILSIVFCFFLIGPSQISLDLPPSSTLIMASFPVSAEEGHSHCICHE